MKNRIPTLEEYLVNEKLDTDKDGYSFEIINNLKVLHTKDGEGVVVSHKDGANNGESFFLSFDDIAKLAKVKKTK